MKKLLSLFFIQLINLSFPFDKSQAQWVDCHKPDVMNVFSFAFIGTNIFIGTADNAAPTGGVYISTNNGNSWTLVNSGLTNTYVLALAVIGTNIFAGTGYTVGIPGGVFLSTNNGTSWTAVNSGLPQTSINVFTVSGTNLFAGTDSGVFLSTNNGTNWTPVNSDFNITYIRALAVNGTNIFAGSYEGGGVFLSTINGTSWTAVNSGLINRRSINVFAISGTNIFAGTDSLVYLSTNNASSWTSVSSGLASDPSIAYTNALAISGGNVFANVSNRVFLSTNDGNSWTAVSDYFYSGISALAVNGTNIFVGETGGVWRRPLSEMITSVERTPTVLPEHFILEQNYPNPFNSTTTILFSIPYKSYISLKLFDALGRELETIVSEEFAAGNYSRQWNAQRLPSGIYFYRLQSGAFIMTKKLVLLK